MADATKAELEWQGGLRFAARSGSGHEVALDSPTRPEHQGASPMELVLVGVAGCTAMDVVAILEKMREPLAALVVSVVGERAPSHPKYFTAIEIVYSASGEGLSREKVERAVELSHERYCSAVASLRPDCRVTTRIELADAAGVPASRST